MNVSLYEELLLRRIVNLPRRNTERCNSTTTEDFFILVDLRYLQPLAETMGEVKRQLCGGNQTFVVAQNPEAQARIADVFFVSIIFIPHVIGFFQP